MTQPLRTKLDGQNQNRTHLSAFAPLIDPNEAARPRPRMQQAVRDQAQPDSFSERALGGMRPRANAMHPDSSLFEPQVQRQATPNVARPPVGSPALLPPSICSLTSQQLMACSLAQPSTLRLGPSPYATISESSAPATPPATPPAQSNQEMFPAAMEIDGPLNGGGRSTSTTGDKQTSQGCDESQGKAGLQRPFPSEDERPDVRRKS